MKILNSIPLLVALTGLSGTAAMAQANASDILIQGSGVSLIVRGSGNFVCSAHDVFRHEPRLGRGASQEEALANAKGLVALINHGDTLFIEKGSCEGSNTGSGAITLTRDANALRVKVEGPALVQCDTVDSTTRPETLFVAHAGSKTEASVLSKNACRSASSNRGFYCRTSCKKMGESGAKSRPPKAPGFKFPKFPFSFRFSATN